MPDNKQTTASSSNDAPIIEDTKKEAAAPNPTPAAEVAVASPIDGSPIPATSAQANATTSNTQEKGTDGAAKVEGQKVGEAFTGEVIDPYILNTNKQKDEGGKKGTAPYVATKGFRHGIKDGRVINASAGDALGDLSAAEAKELTSLGLIEKNSKAK